MSDTGFLKGMSGHQRTNGKTDEWLTPPEIIKGLGSFDLDPCATDSQAWNRRPWPTAKTMYSKQDDGLGREWAGRVWLNPPYGPGIRRWLAKLSKHGNGIALVFARTETGWFQDSVFRTATALFFLSGRIRFYKPDGTPGGFTGGAPSVFIAYGGENATAIAELQMRGSYIRLRW